jgi:hypothetical protein
LTESRAIGAHLASIGWTVKRGKTSGVLLVAPSEEPDGGPPLPPFRVEVGEHWVELVLGPVFPPDHVGPEDLHLRLLTVNRDLRIAKFAMDARGAIVICAELPVESLDREEVVDAASRIVRYFRHYLEFLTGS